MPISIDIKDLVEDLGEEYETTLDGEKIKPNVDRFCHGFRSKVKEGYSQVIVLSSMKKNGMGKSSLLYQMGMDIDPKRFSFDRNFFFFGAQKEIEKQTNSLPTGSILCMDEMVRFWYARQAMTKKVIDLNMWMASDQRKTGVILAGAIPDFWLLDTYARSGKVDYYIEVLARGIGVVFAADRFPKTDPWHADIFDFISRQRQRHTQTSETVEDKVKMLQKHPCYDSMVFWNAMPDAVEQEYLKILNEKKILNDADQGETETDRNTQKWLKKYEDGRVKAINALNIIVQRFGQRGVAPEKCLAGTGLDKRTLDRITAEIKEAQLEAIKDKPT